MPTTRIAAASALALFAALALAGCATTPGGGAAVPSDPSSPTASPSEGGAADDSELDAAWLSGGQGFGLVTWGSSTCLPTVGEVTASGQTVTVELVDPQDRMCTMDYVPRASYVALPAGVDATQEVEIAVTGGTYRGDTDLDGLAEAVPPATGDEADFAASAGWFGDGGIVLLTYGSSSCPPVFASVEVSGAEVQASIAEPPADQVCTADYAPQLSVLQVEATDPRPAELVLLSPPAQGADPQRIAILA
ncbi:hypothetical protein [Microbacterium radiodurans]|uniref:LppP/LprE family lipoprotein n=1 Tax=Microbacterium radiodurans TaxID=661398 RepID=A0A5J5IU68_9MICO|nr:hypothetical protein [Microbacterium radiodurans]KAA9089458.1 hypothetical protein F6B42_02975 [Microbacterium radiodurans]